MVSSIHPAGHYNNHLLSDGSLVYHINRRFPDALTSFDDARHLTLWANHVQPFGCAVVNPDSSEVILARDHLGLVPLYYCHHQGKHLIFGESIPAILAQLPSTPKLLEHQIDMLFSETKHYSDETFYQGIYRVEPGHLMHFKADGSVVKKAFWQLEPHGAVLHYDTDQDYLDHFTQLMTEAIHHATDHHSNIAAEFSAGLDSSAVYCAAANINIKPMLYMHVASPGTKAAEVYNASYENAFIEQYQLTGIQKIGANGFDPLAVFREHAALFAGPAPYLFFMFANRVHRAVEAGGHPILLSGFGGDQGVSGQIPLNFCMPQLIHQGQYRQALQELRRIKGIKKYLHFAKFMHPELYDAAMKMNVLKRQLKNSFRSKAAKESCLIHPYQRDYYSSVREGEWSLLQGPNSHEVRMRIEYSSLVSKTMGFEYRYPLLYPKLLEFIVSLPLNQKRREGCDRYLIRQYLSQFLPKEVFGAYRKKEGLGIVSSTFDFFLKNFEQGCYQEEFKDIPYSQLVRHSEPSIFLRNNIKGYMLKQEFREQEMQNDTLELPFEKRIWHAPKLEPLAPEDIEGAGTPTPITPLVHSPSAVARFMQGAASPPLAEAQPVTASQQFAR